MTKKMLKPLRDGFPDRSYAGEPYDYIIAPQALWCLLLVGKLHEEAEEIKDDMTNPSEYGDALQVLMDLATVNGVKWADVEADRVAKHARIGGYLEMKVLIREPKIITIDPERAKIVGEITAESILEVQPLRSQS